MTFQWRAEQNHSMSVPSSQSPNRLPAFGSRPVVLGAALFVSYAVWSNVSGWLLSAVGMLGAAGYAVMLAPLCWGMVQILKQHRASVPEFAFLSRRRLRLREWLFVTLLIVSLVGACTTQPFGWDASAYRIPRVQRWLEEHRWCWLNSADDRMDISALAYEWMAAPQLALLKTDRLLFLINLIPYALLPGLLFQAAGSVGLTRRWALFLAACVPFGYCYALQSAGLQNDGIAVFFGLSAVVFGRARSARWLSPWWRFGLCFLSLALLSGLKITNVPMAGVLGIWIAWREWKSLRNLLPRSLKAAPILAACVLCSILPISIANQIHSGHWSGDPENNYRHKSEHPVAAVAANSLFLIGDAITPNPVSARLNSWLANARSDPESWFRKLTELHPHLSYFRFPLLGYEGTSGLGAPLLLILAAMVLGCLNRKSKKSLRTRSDMVFVGLVVTAYGVFMTTVAVHESQRHAAGYYPFLLIAIASALGGRCFPGRLIMGPAVIVAGGLSLAMLLISPLRVVLPASVTASLDAKGAGFNRHREASLEGSALSKAEGQLVWYALSWGAVSNRLHEPYHRGRMIELGSRQAEGLKPSGKGLLFASEKGIEGRFGLSVREFLELIGPHRVIASDAASPEFSRSEVVGTLYEVEDLAKLPPWTARRLYPHK